MDAGADPHVVTVDVNLAGAQGIWALGVD